MDANPSMKDSHADILPQGLQCMPSRTPMGIHAIECNGDKNSFPVEDIDQYGGQSKLMTPEALYIRTLKKDKHARRIPNTKIDTESLV